MKPIITLMIALVGLGTAQAHAQARNSTPNPQNLQSDLNSLGGNEAILRKARQMAPRNRARIVQEREVSRTLRLEVAAGYGYFAGGDPYTLTDNLGLQMDFHINPRWSLGARYYQASNSLSREGARVAQNAVLRPESTFFDATDYLKDTAFATLSWYPVYGKLNLFDLRVAQFDLYTLLGYGQVRLNSGSASTMTAGGGVGIWLTQSFSTRLEARWQSYTDQPQSGPRPLDVTVLSLSFGFLL